MNPDIKFDWGFALFNCHVNNAGERALAICQKVFAEEPTRHLKRLEKDWRDGIMAILRRRPNPVTRMFMTCVFLFVNGLEQVKPEPKTNVERFPEITEIVITMAQDAGMLNRFEPKEKILAKLEICMGAEGVYTSDLEALENWVKTLTPAEKETLAIGEETEWQELIKKAPHNDFHEVQQPQFFTMVWEYLTETD